MTVHLEVTTENLLNAVAQMSEGEFNRFVEKARQLRTRRKKPESSDEETDLIYKINSIYSTEKRRRYQELYAKFAEETITPGEHKELLKLNDEFEMLNAERLRYLGELALMRGQSLRDVMKNLGIKS